MRDIELFQAALGLQAPWKVVESSFDADELRIDFERGARFPCPECDLAGCPVHDTEQKTWRHLDFFQHQAFLSACSPRALRRARRPIGRRAVGRAVGSLSCSRR